MAKIIEIVYSEGKTIQEESYEPRNIHLSAKMEIVEGDDIKQAYKELKEVVKRELAFEQSKYELNKKVNKSNSPF